MGTGKEFGKKKRLRWDGEAKRQVMVVVQDEEEEENKSEEDKETQKEWR